MRTFNKLAGVPLHYDREPAHPYGSMGRPFATRAKESFHLRLDACFKELFKICPLGKAKVIATAGAFVNKTGMHGKGRAFDLDALFWDEKRFITSNYPSDKKFYLAIESVLRRHFGLVLNYLYNAEHQDHFHITDQVEVGFDKDSKQRVLYLQAALTHVHNESVIIDGDWGRQTTTATQKVLKSLGISGTIADKSAWMKFLKISAVKGFEDLNVQKTPGNLLENIYEVINFSGINQDKKREITSALNEFVNHGATQKWLDSME